LTKPYSPLEILLKRGYIWQQDKAPETYFKLTPGDYRLIHDRKRTGKMAEN
jgi:hypothetical protein